MSKEEGEPTSRLMDLGLKELMNLLIEMGRLSEQTVSSAIEAYIGGKDEVENIKRMSEELRTLEDEVSDLSTDIIAKYQPMASDLRFTKSCVEISYGFSRLGRYAYDIAETIQSLGDVSNCDHDLVLKTAELAKKMISMSVQALLSRDTELASSIPALDDEVDRNYRMFMKNLSSDVHISAKCAASTALVLKYLERIADHASYIGDSIVYVATGNHKPRK